MKLAMKLTRARMLLACGCVAVLGAGCNQTPPAEPNAVAPNGAKPRKIAAILMQDDQFFRLNEIGMKAAAKKYNVELLTGNASGEQDKEISLTDTYATQGVDAVLVSPLKDKSTALTRANGKGIKVITYNSRLKEPFVAAALTSDDVDLGRQTGKKAVEYIKKHLGGKASIGVIEFISFSAELGPLRPNGFKEEIAKLPGAKIVAEQDAWMPNNAEKTVRDMLSAHPEINVIWAANEGGTVGAVTGVKNAGKAGKVAVFGTDISEQLADFLLANDNILQAVTGQKPYEMGFSTVETAVNVLDGKKPKPLTILPGVVYSRDKPDEIKKYQDDLKKLLGS